MYAVSLIRRMAVNGNTFGGFMSSRYTRGFRGQRSNITSKIHPPTSPFEVESYVTFRSLFKPFVFTVCFSGGTFICASIWQYENMRKKAQSLLNIRSWRNFQYSPSYNYRGGIKDQISAWWHSHTEGQKIAMGIAGLNLLVFLMWRIPRLQPLMQTYFCSSPAMKATCLPMLLSVFSHYNFMHLAVNMYVLYSFSSTAVSFFGKEQFLALYCSSGVISSFASHVHKIAVRSFGPSLGASGALMAVLSSCCIQFPNAQLQIIFLPFFTVAAGTAIKCVMAMDLCGILAKWKIFDHAAHLGGALFGVYYVKYGCDQIWGNREHIISWWHRLRQKFKKT